MEGDFIELSVKAEEGGCRGCGDDRAAGDQAGIGAKRGLAQASEGLTSVPSPRIIKVVPTLPAE
jgi:hypothetical protein